MTEAADRDYAAARQSRRRRTAMWVAAVLIVVGAVVLVWFQPQKLFIDDRVDEAIPTVPATLSTTPAGGPGTASASSTAPPDPAELVEVARGDFISRDHGTSGVARVLELSDGRRVLRLEDLNTDNGPDLYLYLTTNSAEGSESAFDDDVVNLGRLKGNLGDQNYDLHEGTDLGRYTTVVIWCDRFDSAFGAADLTAA